MVVMVCSRKAGNMRKKDGKLPFDQKPIYFFLISVALQISTSLFEFRSRILIEKCEKTGSYVVFFLNA